MKSHTFPLVYHFLISVDNGGFIHEKVYSNSTGRCDGDSGISACRKENSNKETKVQKDSDIKVVTTIFPEYDWVRQIAGEEADQMDITMLLDNGVDLHSYQPTAEDIMKVSDCDLFVYVGGESDAWWMMR